MTYKHATIRLSIVLLCAPLAAIIHSAALAQSTLRLDQGTRVRVNLEEAQRSIVATLVEVKRDTLVLGRTYGSIEATMPFAVAEIRKLEIWTGKGSSLAPFGALAGMLVGAAIVGSYNGIVSSQCFRSCPEDKSVWLAVGIGGVLGGVSLAFVRPDRWLEIAVPGKKAAPGSGGR
jgi:hypothetical protein